MIDTAGAMPIQIVAAAIIDGGSKKKLNNAFLYTHMQYFRSCYYEKWRLAESPLKRKKDSIVTDSILLPEKRK